MLSAPSLSARAFDGRSAHVVDLAYGRLHTRTVDESVVRTRDVSALTNGVDAPSVVVEGAVRHPGQAWATTLAELLDDAGVDVTHTPVVLTVPTTWGAIRRRVFGSLNTTVPEVALVSRAALIADTHAEHTADVVAVAEVIGDRLDLHRVVQNPEIGWEVTRTDVIGLNRLDAIDEALGDDVGLVLVDTDRRRRLSRIVSDIARECVTGRVVAVEPALLHKFGGRPGSPRFAVDAPEQPRGGRHRIRSSAVVAVIAVLAALIGWRAWWIHPEPVSADHTVVAGRLRVTVPAGWQTRSSAPTADGIVPKLVVVDPDRGGRLVILTNRLREDATQGTVVASLARRAAERGSAVEEFSPATYFGDRAVISYRETPGSGESVRWYVVVAESLQVSIGCQPGTAGDSVDGECSAAVRSASLVPATERS